MQEALQIIRQQCQKDYSRHTVRTDENCDHIMSKNSQSQRAKNLNRRNIPFVEHMYEGWNFNSGNYLFTTDTK